MDIQTHQSHFITFVQSFQNSHPILTHAAELFRLLIIDECLFVTIPFIPWIIDFKKGNFVLLCLATSEILNGMLKFSFCVVRPYVYYQSYQKINPDSPRNLSNKLEIDYSFPSSHAQTTATFATAVLLKWWKHGVQPQNAQCALYFLFIIPFLTGLSRVYLGVHWPLCVLCGWTIGILWTYLLDYCKIDEWFINLEFGEGILFTFGVYITIIGLFGLIKWYKKQDNKIICGMYNLDCDKTHDIYKYSLQIGTLIGGMIGIHLTSNQTTKYFDLMILFEHCTLNWNQFIQILSEGTVNEKPLYTWTIIFPILIKVGIGLFGLICISIPTFIIIPKLLKNMSNKNDSHEYSTKLIVQNIRLCLFVLTGLWVSFLCPYTVQVLYGESSQCHLFYFENDIDLAILSGNNISNNSHNSANNNVSAIDPFINEIGEYVDSMCMASRKSTKRATGMIHDSIEQSPHTRLHIPHNVEQLKQVVARRIKLSSGHRKTCTQKQANNKLRVIGAGLSSPTWNFVKDTLNRNSSAGELQNQEEKQGKEKIEYISLEHFNYYKYNESSNIVTVGAGLSICGHFVLNKTRNHISNITWNHDYSLVKRLEKDNLALPIIGGVCHQSFGGFITTGSNGGSRQYHLLNIITNLKFITGNGNILSINKGEENFNLATVSLGLLGVLYEISFTPVPYYCTLSNGKSIVSADFTNKNQLDSLLNTIDSKSSVGEYFHGYLGMPIEKRDNTIIHAQLESARTVGCPWESGDTVRDSPQTDRDNVNDTELEYNMNNIVVVRDHISLPKHNQIGAFVVMLPFSSNFEECVEKFAYGKSNMYNIFSGDDGGAPVPIQQYIDIINNEGTDKEDQYFDKTAKNVFYACINTFNDLILDNINNLDKLIENWNKNGPDVRLTMMCIGPQYSVMQGKNILSDWYKMISWESGDNYNEDIWLIGELDHLELNIPLYQQSNNANININTSDYYENNTIFNVFSTIGEHFKNSKWWELTWAPVEFYFSPPIDQYKVSAMSESHSYLTLRICFFGHPWQSIKNNKNQTGMYHKFDKILSLFYNNGIKFRLHWGKYIPWKRSDESFDYYNIITMIRNEYPLLEKFKSFVETHDPYALFQTQYWRDILW